MCDFSQYGGTSNEWLAVAASEPPPSTGLSTLEIRAASNAAREQGSAAMFKAMADYVELIDVSIPTRDGATLEGRLYWPASVPKAGTGADKPAIFMHLHGGGYLIGTLASEDALCAAVAVITSSSSSSTPVVVLNVNYRHTPEHKYPTAWLDAQDALAWIHDTAVPQFGIDPARVVVGGVSAGAHLAASLVLEQNLGKLQDKTLPPIAGQVLMIPCVVNIDCYAPQMAQMASPAVSSVTENEFAPLLPMSSLRLFTDLLEIKDPMQEGTFLSPGNAEPEQVRGLPPTVFGICGLDPLRDEALLYAKLLAEQGVPTDIHLYKGVPHAFRIYGEKLSLSQAWDDTMTQGIVWALSNPAATKKFDVKVHGEETM